MAGAIVQNGYNVDDSGGTATTIAVTLTGVIAGNHLVAHVGWANTALTATVSDGSAFSVGDTKRVDGTNNQSGEVFYRENVGAGSHTITATISSAAAFRRLRVFEVSGLQTATSLDQATGQNQATPGTTANAVSSGATSATTNATDFVMGFSQNILENDPGTGTVTAGTGYTISGTNLIMCLETKSVVATGAQTATFTQSVNNTRTTHVVAFKEAAASTATVGWPTFIAGPGNHPGPRRFAPLPRAFPVATNVTVALTGSSIAFSSGTLVPSTTVPLVGTQYVWSAGALTPSNSLVMTGTAVAFAAGTLTPSTAVALVGSLVTFSTDTITASTNGDLTLALTGTAIAFSAGTLTPSASVALTGSAETYSTGTIAVNRAQALTGTAEAYSTGVLTPSTTVSVAGSLVSYSAGTLTAQAGGDITVALTGTSFAFSTDTLTASGADSASQPSGGFFYDIDHFRSRKRAERDRLKRHESDTAQLEAVDRQIAELLRDQELKDIERAELKRIQQLADDYSGRNLGLPRRISASLLKAYEERSRNALEQLARELERMLEEEELTLLQLLLNDED